MSATLRIGSRGSALALWQAEHVKTLLAGLGHDATIEVITTTGDRVLDRRLEAVGGKGAFLKEIEEALLARGVDLAVHSLKDVPTELPQGLVLCAYLERADARDGLISYRGDRLDQLPVGARVGTTSLRRQAQLRASRGDLQIMDLRGNVDTRLRKVQAGEFDAIVLAMAGVTRLGRAAEITQVLEPEIVLPAPGQGIVALECRADDARVLELGAALDHEPTARCAHAERGFLAALGGGCNVPLGAWARISGGQLELQTLVAREDGSELLRATGQGAEPVELGQRLAADLIARGAAAFLNKDA
jgi:hydroxymethylbilane synthase